jgi:hypothetical protein
MKLNLAFTKIFINKLYKQRGKNRRINRLGGWGAMAERQIISTLSREISKEIDNEILKRLKEYAEANINS